MEYDKTFFDRRFERRGTDSVKWDNPEIMAEGGVPLWVADMDFECAPPIREALQERAAHPFYGYTMVTQSDYDAVTGFWQRRHGITLNRQEIVLMPSVVSGLRACVTALTRKDDKVLLMTPVYAPFYFAVRDAGRTVVEAPLLTDDAGRYFVDFERVETCLRDGAAMVMVCSPHNPVSRPWGAEELRAISALCSRYHARLLVDEIHCDFVYAPESFTGILGLPGIDEGVISLTAASKTFNIAGLKQSYLFCRDKKTVSELNAYFTAAGAESGNIFALTASRAAFTACDEWLDGLMEYMSESRDLVYRGMKNLLPEARVTPIEATYLAWVDVRAYGKSNDALMKCCYQHGVALNNGALFGEEAGEGFMRLNFGCPRTQLLEGMERFAAAVKHQ